VKEATGRKDRDGNDIHEGDVIFKEGKGFYIVKWNANVKDFVLSFGDKEDQFTWLKAVYSDIYKIEGNVYDDPQMKEWVHA
jgi:hypothetical protein